MTAICVKNVAKESATRQNGEEVKKLTAEQVQKLVIEMQYFRAIIHKDDVLVSDFESFLERVKKIGDEDGLGKGFEQESKRDSAVELGEEAAIISTPSKPNPKPSFAQMVKTSGKTKSRDRTITRRGILF